MITQFGFIDRGELPYYHKYHNVELSGETDGHVVLSCKVHDPIMLSHYIVSKNLCDGNFLISLTTQGKKLNFTCEVSREDYTHFYKLNDIILFTCRNDPNNLIINYSDNMKCIINKWTFIDH